MKDKQKRNVNKSIDKCNLSELEIKQFLFYGTPKIDSEIKIDNEEKIDYAILQMFDLLEEQTHFNRKKIEKIFWKRIRTLTNNKLKNKL